MNDTQQSEAARMNGTCPSAGSAFVCTNTWYGRMEYPVRILGETPKRYRVTPLNGATITLPRRFLHGDETALVPKTAVKIVPNNNMSSGD